MKCFEIDINNDVLPEAVENFTVTVVPVAGDVGVTEPDMAVVCITDDDGKLSIVSIEYFREWFNCYRIAGYLCGKQFLRKC